MARCKDKRLTASITVAILERVVLTVIDGVQDVQSSNFGSNSFQLTNTGNKEIAAVFIDIRDAVFGDMVFDNDGTAAIQLLRFSKLTAEGQPAGFLWAKTIKH